MPIHYYPPCTKLGGRSKTLGKKKTGNRTFTYFQFSIMLLQKNTVSTGLKKLPVPRFQKQTISAPKTPKSLGSGCIITLLRTCSMDSSQSWHRPKDRNLTPKDETRFSLNRENNRRSVVCFKTKSAQIQQFLRDGIKFLVILGPIWRYWSLQGSEGLKKNQKRSTYPPSQKFVLLVQSRSAQNMDLVTCHRILKKGKSCQPSFVSWSLERLRACLVSVRSRVRFPPGANFKQIRFVLGADSFQLSSPFSLLDFGTINKEGPDRKKKEIPDDVKKRESSAGAEFTLNQKLPGFRLTKKG
jgi:hypothetical protein